MGLEVTTEPQADAPVITPEQMPVAHEAKPKDTPLRSLKAARDKLINQLYIELKVPRWDNPELFVRYKAVESSRVAAQARKRAESEDPELLVLANADLLANCCVGIYAVFDGDGVRRSLRLGDEFGEWTRFDRDLMDNLEMPPYSKAADAVRQIYATDGDLISAAEAVSEWSAKESTKADENFSKA